MVDGTVISYRVTANFGREFDLNGGVERQLIDADGGANVLAGLTKNLHHQIARAVGDLRLVGETRRTVNINGKPNNSGNTINTAGRLRGNGEGVQTALSGSARGIVETNIAADLAHSRQLAFDHRNLAADKDEVADPRARDI